MLEKSILHLDLDTFFVSCERLLNPKLNGKPIIIGGTTGRGVVASCSYEARAFGVRSAMSMKLARMICPEAIVIKGNSGIYSKFSNHVSEIIKENAPLFEKASVDEFYIDITGMDRFYGCQKWSSELRSKLLKETHLPISFALSVNKTVSKIGTQQAKPNGFLQIESGREKSFLAPLSLMEIPVVGEKTYELLSSMGIKYIKTVQKMPIRLMQAALGANGISIWEKCQGIDRAPVIPYHHRKSIGIERTFEHDTIDMVKLNSILVAMAENLAFQLRNGNKLTACVTVKIRYADLSYVTKQRRLPYTASDSTLIETSKDLFKSVYDKRMMIRLIGLRYSNLVEGGYQINLLEDTVEMVNLHQAMDHLRKRFGQDAVKRAIALGSRNIGRVNPFNGEPPMIPAHRRA